MGSLHSLIEEKGRLEAMREGSFARREIEAASAYMAREGTGVEFIYSGLCQAALPHRRLPDGKGWQIISDHITLIVEPGMVGGIDSPRHIGVPYGSRARLIMLYLQSEALRTGDPRVHLGGSMRAWLKRMGVSWGGKSGIAIRDQALRISKCHISFESRAFRVIGMKSQTIVEDAMFLNDGNQLDQGSLFPEIATLSQKFFEGLQQHSVPLEEAAIRTISNNSVALDLYAWLAYRLWALKSPCQIGWPSLKNQFGQGFGMLRHFRATFNDNLRLALAVYRDARVEVDDTGITLHPSPPPVRRRLVANGRGKVPTQTSLLA